MECSKFSSLIRSQDHSISGEHPPPSHHHIVKSTSSDNPGMSMGTPVSASEVAAALLGASTSSLSGYRQRPRRIEEEDLSTPYSHYKCLSPKDRLGKLRRQFSLDRAPDESRDRCVSTLNSFKRTYLVTCYVLEEKLYQFIVFSRRKNYASRTRQAPPIWRKSKR